MVYACLQLAFLDKTDTMVEPEDLCWGANHRREGKILWKPEIMCNSGFTNQESRGNGGVIGLRGSQSQNIKVRKDQGHLHDDVEPVVSQDSRGELGVSVCFSFVPRERREHRGCGGFP